MLNIGLIGCGYWGPNLVRTFNELEDCRMVRVCDLKVGRLAFIKKRYPFIEVSQNYKDIIGDTTIDAVCVATPVTTHFDFAREAIQAGKHVFVEKPLAYTTRQAEELVHLADKSRLKIFVGHIFQYAPAIRQIEALIKSDELGQLFYLDSERLNLGPPASEVDVIWDLAPHDVSIILHLIDGQINGETLEVSALGHNYVRKNLIDMAHLWLKFKNSLLAHIHVSWLSPNKTRITQIIGSKSVIVYDDMLPIGKVKIFREGIDNRVNAKDTDAIQLAYRPGNIEMPALENYEPLRAECEHFLECIKNGRQPISGGEMGLRVVKILEAASQSIREGGKVVRCKL